MPTINFGGLASGLDTQAIIQAILGVERQPLERIQQRQFEYNEQKTQFDELRSKLNGFEGALRDLSSARTFRGRIATVSNESTLRATAGSGADTGIFEVTVNNLASAHKVRSDGFIAPDDGLIADGTITLQSGSGDPITINVSAATGNNTLDAIRDEINTADAGVSAAVLFDGSNYLLTVRSEETGTANALTITDDTNLNLDDSLNNITDAKDAEINVDGIDITSASNKIQGVISGVTFDLLSADAGTVSLEIAQDTDAVVSAVQDLVQEYNDIVSFFNSQFDRDNPGPLAGDPTARQIQSQLQFLFTGGIEGVASGGIRSLSSVGVSFDGKTGEASLDTAALRDLLDTNFDEVGDLFVASGSATSPKIQFSASSGTTGSGEYAVSISQAAERASVAGSAAITTLAQNETLTVTVGGESTTVDLLAGDTVDDVVGAVNTALNAAGISAFASADGGALRISSGDYGSSADVSVSSDLVDTGSGTQSGFDTTAAADTGLDVAGTIDGVAATGAGRFLTAGEGTSAAGLTLKVTASAADITASGGDFGTLFYSRGLVNTVVEQIDQLTRLGDGLLDLTSDSLDARVRGLNKDIDRIRDRLASREVQLIQQFTRAEQAIAALQSQQNTLGGFQVR